MENLYPEGTSIKLVVHPQLSDNDKDSIPSISFTCNGMFIFMVFMKRKNSLNVLIKF